MKRFNVFFIAAMLLVGMVMAQPGSGRTCKNVSPETRAAKMTERMTKELSLNDKQAKEVEAINLELVTQLAANKLEKPASSCCQKQDKVRKQEKKEKNEMKKMRGNMKEARNAHEAKLKNILTKEQFAKYQKENEQREARTKSDKRNNN